MLSTVFCKKAILKKIEAQRKTPVPKSPFNEVAALYMQALLKAKSPQLFFKTCFVTALLEKLELVVVKSLIIKNYLINR